MRYIPHQRHLQILADCFVLSEDEILPLNSVFCSHSPMICLLPMALSRGHSHPQLLWPRRSNIPWPAKPHLPPGLTSPGLTTWITFLHPKPNQTKPNQTKANQTKMIHPPLKQTKKNMAENVQHGKFQPT